MDRGAWRTTLHGVVTSQTRLSTHTHTKIILEALLCANRMGSGQPAVGTCWPSPSQVLGLRDHPGCSWRYHAKEPHSTCIQLLPNLQNALGQERSGKEEKLESR